MQVGILEILGSNHESEANTALEWCSLLQPSGGHVPAFCKIAAGEHTTAGLRLVAKAHNQNLTEWAGT
jgi:hypothetical protein